MMALTVSGERFSQLVAFGEEELIRVSMNDRLQKENAFDDAIAPQLEGTHTILPGGLHR